MLKLVYSRGVDGRREIGRGDPSAGLMIGVNGWFGGAETNEDKTGLMLYPQHLLRNSGDIDLQIRTGECQPFGACDELLYGQRASDDTVEIDSRD
jgi:hypothetical protein